MWEKRTVHFVASIAIYAYKNGETGEGNKISCRDSKIGEIHVSHSHSSRTFRTSLFFLSFLLIELVFFNGNKEIREKKFFVECHKESSSAIFSIRRLFYGPNSADSRWDGQDWHCHATESSIKHFLNTISSSHSKAAHW